MNLDSVMLGLVKRILAPKPKASKQRHESRKATRT